LAAQSLTPDGAPISQVLATELPMGHINAFAHITWGDLRRRFGLAGVLSDSRSATCARAAGDVLRFVAGSGTGLNLYSYSPSDKPREGR
jgi:hypothetical protein